jgi:hypothetical protein
MNKLKERLGIIQYQAGKEKKKYTIAYQQVASLGRRSQGQLGRQLGGLASHGCLRARSCCFGQVRSFVRPSTCSPDVGFLGCPSRPCSALPPESWPSWSAHDATVPEQKVLLAFHRSHADQPGGVIQVRICSGEGRVGDGESASAATTPQQIRPLATEELGHGKLWGERAPAGMNFGRVGRWR